MSRDLVTNWTCPTCAAEVPVDFGVCWSCGTSRDGRTDPAFRPVEECDSSQDGDATDELDPAQFGLRTMFVVVTVSAVALAVSSRMSFAGRFERLFGFGAFLLVTGFVFATINNIVARALGPTAQAIAMIVAVFIAMGIAQELFGLL